VLEGEAVTILHICAGWEKSNGAANIARMVAGEQETAGHSVSYKIWAGIKELRAADEVWIHCAWKPCLWLAALWARRYKWMPEASYDPVRLGYHGWKKRLVGPIERFFLRRADVVVATCQAEAEWIRKYEPRVKKIELTDLKRFFKLQGTGNREQGTGKALHLLYLGRCHPLKGLEYLEEAVRQISSVPCSLFPVPPQLKVVSNAFGEEKERVWEWCDVLILPTLSENFGRVVAEALERGKRVITTDGAPAWSPSASATEDKGDCSDYGGRLVYLKGYRDGLPDERVRLLKKAIEELACR
jgi:hypothetical protein